MFRTEQRQKAFGPAQGLSLTTKPISEYMANIFHGIIDDPYVDKTLDVIDPKTVMWGSDFPHPRCTFPNSEEIVDKTFGNLPQDVQDDLAFNNAARFYNIEVPKSGRAIIA